MTHLCIRSLLEDYFQTGMSFVSRDGNVYHVVYQHGGAVEVVHAARKEIFTGID